MLKNPLFYIKKVHYQKLAVHELASQPEPSQAILQLDQTLIDASAEDRVSFNPLSPSQGRRDLRSFNEIKTSLDDIKRNQYMFLVDFFLPLLFPPVQSWTTPNCCLMPALEVTKRLHAGWYGFLTGRTRTQS